MIITYKYKLRYKSYAKSLKRYAIALNQVWNYNVSIQRKFQTDWKNSAPIQMWLSEYSFNKITAGVSKDLNVHAGSIHEINRIFVRGRDTHKKSPKFRISFGSKRSLGWVPFRATDRQVYNNSVKYLNKTYKWFKNRPLPENPKLIKGGAFIEDSCGDWWVIFDVEIEKDLIHGNGKIGIDLGLKTMATLSDGSKIESPKAYKNLENSLKIAQRANNKKQVKRIHRKIKNIRNDHQHKETTKLIKNNQFVAVGNIKPNQLIKNKIFTKPILDVSWGRFKDLLQYKASRHGVNLILVDERYSSQLCHVCDQITDGSPKGIADLGIREWVCSNCKTSLDRDVNAAYNILKIGLGTQPLAEENNTSIL